MAGRQNITQRIVLLGGEKIRAELKLLGEAGEKAFAGINGAANGLESGTLTSTLQQAQDDLAKVAGSFDSISTSLRQVGRTMTTRLTLPIAAFGGASLKAFADFEKGMSSVSTLIDENTESLDEMGNALLDVSGRVPVSIQELTDALYQLRSAGVASSDAMALLESSAKLGVAGLGTTAQAVDLATSILNTWGDELGERTYDGERFTKTLDRLQKSMVNLSDIAGKFQGPVDNIRKFGFSLNELVQNTKAGGETFDNIRKGIRSIHPELNELKSSLDLTNASAEEQQRIFGLIFIAIKNGKTTLAQLSQGFGAVASTVEGAGIAIDEYLAAVSALTTTGLPAAQAHTQIRAAIIALSRDTAETIPLFKELGVKTFPELVHVSGGMVQAFERIVKATGGNQAALIKLLGSAEAYAAVMGLATNVNRQFFITLDDMRSGVDSLEPAFQKRLGDVTASTQLLSNAFNRLLISIGSDLAPAFTAIAKAITNITNTFNAMPPIVRQTIVVIAAVVAAFGPLYLVLGFLTSGFAKLLKFGSLVIGMFATLSKAGGLTKLIKGFAEFAGTITFITPLMKLVSGLATVIGGVIAAIAGLVIAVGPLLVVVGVIAASLGTLTAAFATLLGISAQITGFGGAVTALLNFVRFLISLPGRMLGPITLAAGVMAYFWDTLIELAENGFDAVVEQFASSGGWKFIANEIVETFTDVFSIVKGLFDTVDLGEMFSFKSDFSDRPEVRSVPEHFKQVANETQELSSEVEDSLNRLDAQSRVLDTITATWDSFASKASSIWKSVRLAVWDGVYAVERALHSFGGGPLIFPGLTERLLGDLRDSFLSVTEGITDVFLNMWKNIKGIFEEDIVPAKTLRPEVELITLVSWEETEHGFQKVTQEIEQTWFDRFSNVEWVQVFDRVWQNVKDLANEAATSVAGYWTAALASIGAAIGLERSGLLGTAWEKTVEGAEWATDGIKAVWAKLAQNFKTNVAPQLGKSLNTAWSIISKAATFAIENITPRIAGLLSIFLLVFGKRLLAIGAWFLSIGQSADKATKSIGKFTDKVAGGSSLYAQAKRDIGGLGAGIIALAAAIVTGRTILTAFGQIVARVFSPTVLLIVAAAATIRKFWEPLEAIITGFARGFQKLSGTSAEIASVGEVVAGAFAGVAAGIGLVIDTLGEIIAPIVLTREEFESLFTTAERWGAITREVFERIGSGVQNFRDTLQQVANGINRTFGTEITGNMLSLGAALAALAAIKFGGGLTAIGSFLLGFGKRSKDVTSDITSLIGSLTGVNTTLENGRIAMHGSSRNLTTLGTAFAGVAATLTGRRGLSGALDFVVGLFTPLRIALAVSALAIRKYWEPLTGVFTAVVGGLVDGFKEVFGVVDTATNTITDVGDAVTAVGASIGAVAVGIIKAVTEALRWIWDISEPVEAVDGQFDSLRATVKDFGVVVAQVVKHVMEQFQSFMGFMNGVAEAFNAVFGTGLTGKDLAIGGAIVLLTTQMNSARTAAKLLVGALWLIARHPVILGIAALSAGILFLADKLSEETAMERHRARVSEVQFAYEKLQTAIGDSAEAAAKAEFDAAAESAAAKANADLAIARAAVQQTQAQIAQLEQNEFRNASQNARLATLKEELVHLEAIHTQMDRNATEVDNAILGITSAPGVKAAREIQEGFAETNDEVKELNSNIRNLGNTNPFPEIGGAGNVRSVPDRFKSSPKGAERAAENIVTPFEDADTTIREIITSLVNFVDSEFVRLSTSIADAAKQMSNALGEAAGKVNALQGGGKSDTLPGSAGADQLALLEFTIPKPEEPIPVELEAVAPVEVEVVPAVAPLAPWIALIARTILAAVIEEAIRQVTASNLDEIGDRIAEIVNKVSFDNALFTSLEEFQGLRQIKETLEELESKRNVVDPRLFDAPLQRLAEFQTELEEARDEVKTLWDMLGSSGARGATRQAFQTPVVPEFMAEIENLIQRMDQIHQEFSRIQRKAQLIKDFVGGDIPIHLRIESLVTFDEEELKDGLQNMMAFVTGEIGRLRDRISANAIDLQVFKSRGDTTAAEQATATLNSHLELVRRLRNNLQAVYEELSKRNAVLSLDPNTRQEYEAVQTVLNTIIRDLEAVKNLDLDKVRDLLNPIDPQLWEGFEDPFANFTDNQLLEEFRNRLEETRDQINDVIPAYNNLNAVFEALQGLDPSFMEVPLEQLGEMLRNMQQLREHVDEVREALSQRNDIHLPSDANLVANYELVKILLDTIIQQLETIKRNNKDLSFELPSFESDTTLLAIPPVIIGVIAAIARALKNDKVRGALKTGFSEVINFAWQLAWDELGAIGGNNPQENIKREIQAIYQQLSDMGIGHASLRNQMAPILDALDALAQFNRLKSPQFMTNPLQQVEDFQNQLQSLRDQLSTLFEQFDNKQEMPGVRAMIRAADEIINRAREEHARYSQIKRELETLKDLQSQVQQSIDTFRDFAGDIEPLAHPFGDINNQDLLRDLDTAMDLIIARIQHTQEEINDNALELQTRRPIGQPFENELKNINKHIALFGGLRSQIEEIREELDRRGLTLRPEVIARYDMLRGILTAILDNLRQIRDVPPPDEQSSLGTDKLIGDAGTDKLADSVGEDAGLAFSTGFQTGVGTLAAAISQLFDDTLPVVEESAVKAADTYKKSLLQRLRDASKNPESIASQPSTNILDTSDDSTQPALDQLRIVAERTWKMLKRGAGITFDQIKGMFSRIFSFEGEITPEQSVVQAFSNVGPAISETLLNSSATVSEAFRALLTPLVEIARAGGTSAGNALVMALRSAAANVATTIQSHVSSLISAVNGMISQVRAALASLRAEIAATKSAAASASSSGSSSSVPALASGGPIVGPGTATSDSILIRAANGEFMMQARAVRKYGSKFMHMVNNGKLKLDDLIKGFASGGPISVDHSSSVFSGLTNGLGNINATAFIPAMAGGGAVADAKPVGRPISLQIGGETIDGLTGTDDAVDRLYRIANTKRLRSAGRKPGWSS